MKVFLFLVFAMLAACNHSDEEASDKNSWLQHESFRANESTQYSSKATNGNLFSFGPYTTSSINLDNEARHAIYLNYDSLEATGIIGEKYFTKTISGLSAITYAPILDIHDNSIAHITFEGESWLSKVPNKGTLIRPGFKSFGGAKPFGIANDSEEIATLVYAPNPDSQTEYCYVAVLGFQEQESSKYPFLYFKHVSEIPSRCTANNISYATNGTDFYISTNSDVGVLRMSQDGIATKIGDFGGSDIFYSQAYKSILLQDGTDLYTSTDEGLSWNLIWEDTQNNVMNYFEVGNNLYFFRNKQIFRLEIGESSVVATELENSGIDAIDSTISSVTEFNNIVYVTTLGSGVYYKALNVFDEPLE